VSEQKRVEFHGRFAEHYPERHANARRVTTYNDFADSVRRCLRDDEDDANEDDANEDDE
jgi:hypothetical protein